MSNEYKMVIRGFDSDTERCFTDIFMPVLFVLFGKIGYVAQSERDADGCFEITVSGPHAGMEKWIDGFVNGVLANMEELKKNRMEEAV